MSIKRSQISRKREVNDNYDRFPAAFPTTRERHQATWGDESGCRRHFHSRIAEARAGTRRAD
jgi:hypothetical protein